MNFTRPIHATADEIDSVLRPTEAILSTQAGVALYDRKEPSTLHQDGTLILTTQRLFYFPTLLPTKHSLVLELRNIKQTQYWIGIYFKSSPKIILVLSSSSSSTPGPSSAGMDPLTTGMEEGNWVCGVCGMRNNDGRCSLCGVNKSAGSTRPNTPLPPTHSSSPSPSFRTTTPTPVTIVKTADGRIVCSQCTYLNHPSMKKCELCDQSLRPSTISSPIPRPSTPSSRPISNGAQEEINKEDYIKISFRKGGEKVVYSLLKDALSAKDWPEEDVAVVSPKRGGGIDGILKTLASASQETSDDMDSALKDLDALMLRAKDMIILAKQMNEKLSLQESSPLPSTPASQSTSIRTSLLTLGLSTPAITPDMLAKDQEYHRELARELEGMLSGVMGRGGRGVVGLDEVWCLWNRARGVSLISPKDLKQSLPFLSSIAPSVAPSVAPSSRSTTRTASRSERKISSLTLPSGITVLHTGEFSPRAFGERLLDLIDLRMSLFLSVVVPSTSTLPPSSTSSPLPVSDDGTKIRNGLSTLEVAREVGEGIPFGLIKELLEIVEREGRICRDDYGVEGVYWFRNYFVEAS